MPCIRQFREAAKDTMEPSEEAAIKVDNYTTIKEEVDGRAECSAVIAATNMGKIGALQAGKSATAVVGLAT